MFSQISKLLIAKKGILTNSIFLLAILCVTSAQAIDVTVVGSDGVTPVSGFRWTLEMDNTHAVTPGNAGATDTLSFDFHASHARTLASGISTGETANITLPGTAATDRYYITVTPHTGHDMSGVAVNGTQAAVTVEASSSTVPTAQISVFAFKDMNPINNAPDFPNEKGLAGYDVLVIDAAGTYGAAGGQIIQDTFGNPLDTTYQRTAGVIDLDAEGNPIVAVLGTGVLKTGDGTPGNPLGVKVVKNLAPGKYGIQVLAPAGAEYASPTSTIEGSRVTDAWVQGNEPAHFMEFGGVGHHVWMGFVKITNDATVLTGGSTITGQVRNIHNSRPPEFTFYTGAPVANCWVGLNELGGGAAGRGIYAMPCNDDATFAIPNVPKGDYQLVVWDDALFNVIALLAVSVDGTGEHALNDVPVFNWFARQFNTVFWDGNENGFPDDSEIVGAVNGGGMLEQGIVLRFRNGQVYRAMPTDLAGESPMEEIFPFFNWLVAEVDFARFKATGVTYVVDAGGPVNPDQGWDNPTFDMTTPQPQGVINPNTGNDLSTTIAGPVLTLPFQGFLGQTNHVFWGKTNYEGEENGGISGIVFYATARAEERPMWAAAEEWEFGIPNVQVNLYQDSDADGVVDDINLSGAIEYADVDNYPQNDFPGPGDVDHNLNGLMDNGDALEVTHTDSWDDSKPTSCVGDTFTFNGLDLDCFDGMRNYNQIREGIFDGGYAFAGFDPVHSADGLMPGNYIVATATPPGYVLLKEEDKNVDFGISFTPQLLPAECVGDMHTIPTYLTFNSDGENPLPGVALADLIETNKAVLGDVNGQSPLCDRKKVPLVAQTNAAADFFLFTHSPKSARAVGIVMNDLANEFDANAPTFGEKAAPPWVPVAFRDWQGKVVARVHSDEFGKYNALLPSTYTANLPIPSGMQAQMLSACVNDASAQPNPTYQPDPAGINFDPIAVVNDPYYNPQFSQFCYNLQFMTGATTYLDTPVFPIAAFAGNGNFPVDCEVDNGTPKIYSVDGLAGVAQTGAGVLTIYSMGTTADVPNPAYNGSNAKTITRDYSFGAGIAPGTVTIGGVTIPTTYWGPNAVRLTVPLGTASGQLVVTKASGVSTATGITVTVGGTTVHQVPSATLPTIQAGIDAAAPGDMVLVAPGYYEEIVIMYKPILLQGSGSGTIINAISRPSSRLVEWRDKMRGLYVPANTRQFDLLDGQQFDATADPATLEGGLLAREEGAGITVVALEKNRKGANASNQLFADFPSRIDGIQINGANYGGAILVNGWAHGLQISNNRLYSNQGNTSGGIRIGDSMLDSGGDDYNLGVTIHHNEVLQNGNIGGAGGGISMYAGSTDYQVTENRVCGNLSNGHGGGIGHMGLSDNALIANNEVTFNQSFNQMFSRSGGGIFVGGRFSAPNAEDPGAAADITEGSGSVLIDSNLIQGNNAGGGDGGGISLSRIDGTGINGKPCNTNGPIAKQCSTSPTANWDDNAIDVTNNIIVNNVSGMAGGGISIQDAISVDINNNTVANNDSTATAGEAFDLQANISVAQPAGIASRVHSGELAGRITGSASGDPYRNFSRPFMTNNIIWQNRSFYFAISLTDPSQFGLVPNIGGGDAAVYNDLGVVGYTPLAGEEMTSTNSILTGDIGANPAFIADYANGTRGQTIIQGEVGTSIATAVAFDEGGNFIDIHYGPLTLDGGNDGTRDSDYHVGSTSTAIDAAAAAPAPATDFDGQARPLGLADDIGADEAQ